MSGLQTSFELFLPKGFVDDDGLVHRDVTMRLATARDELEPLRDPRVRDAEDPFLTLVVLARVLARIGPFEDITAEDVCSLFAADLAYLQDVYGAVNFGSAAEIAEVVADADARRAEAIEEALAEEALAQEGPAEVAFDSDEAGREEVVEIDAVDAPQGASDHELDGVTIDAEALAAALQARFGEDLEHADDESDGPRQTVPSRRRRIEEVGARSR